MQKKKSGFRNFPSICHCESEDVTSGSNRSEDLTDLVEVNVGVRGRER